MSSTISQSTSSISVCNKSLERKVRKPKIEKLRRARINTSLEQLKEILLSNTIWKHTQGPRPTKLEKADILEMSVRYIEMLHDKLLTENSSLKLTDESLEQKLTLETINTIHSGTFRDISNQMKYLNDRNNRKLRFVKDEKPSVTSPLWYYNRFNIHQRNLSTSIRDDNLSDKENCFLNRMREFSENISPFAKSTQESIFSSSCEPHWRPW